MKLLKKIFKRKLIKRRIKIEYFDQNDSFKQYLPKTGTITKHLTSIDGNKNWFLVKLDEPFEYQLKTGDNFQFKLINCDYFLIRSRLENCDINCFGGTSVFILLIPDKSKLNKEIIDIQDFVHIAWGKTKTIYL